MHSPAYTPFSSPRCKAYQQQTESGEDTGKYMYSDTLTIIISIGVSALLLMIFLGMIKRKMYKLFIDVSHLS